MIQQAATQDASAGGGGNVGVFCRFRPLNKKELNLGEGT